MEAPLLIRRWQFEAQLQNWSPGEAATGGQRSKFTAKPLFSNWAQSDL